MLVNKTPLVQTIPTTVVYQLCLTLKPLHDTSEGIVGWGVVEGDIGGYGRLG